MSLRNSEKKIILALAMNVIDIYEALYFANQLPRPLEISGFHVDIDSFSEEGCIKLFRFSQGEIRILVESLNIPDQIKVQEGYTCKGLEALCIALRRLSYPGRWADLQPLFGRSSSSLCAIFLHIVEYLNNTHQNVINFDANRIGYNLQHFSQAIYEAGALLDNCWGFIDGTVRPIARPTKGQRFFFNGHKRTHSIKFQTIVCPDGIIAHCSYPMEGTRHDSALLRNSNIGDIIQNDHRFDGYLIYGDPAYPQNLQYVTGPFKGITNEDQQNFNKEMSKHRVCVEWGFALVLNNWIYLEHKRTLKVLGSPVGSFYLLAVLLTNCLTCLKGSNQVSAHFGLHPPNLNEYLNHQ